MSTTASIPTHSIAQTLLDEFEVQAPITRRFLQRLPADKLTWRPHEKSMTAGQLAFHLASVPGRVVQAIKESSAQAPDFIHPQPESHQAILDEFEISITTVRDALSRYDDHAMNATWRLLAGTTELLAVPRHAFLRDVMLNHWYQHRGQFSVYLRILGVPVPASWGPSADEAPPFLVQTA